MFVFVWGSSRYLVCMWTLCVRFFFLFSTELPSWAVMNDGRRLKWPFDHALLLLQPIETSGNSMWIENVIQLLQYQWIHIRITNEMLFSDALNTKHSLDKRVRLQYSFFHFISSCLPHNQSYIKWLSMICAHCIAKILGIWFFPHLIRSCSLVCETGVWV